MLICHNVDQDSFTRKYLHWNPHEDTHDTMRPPPHIARLENIMVRNFQNRRTQTSKHPVPLNWPSPTTDDDTDRLQVHADRPRFVGSGYIPELPLTLGGHATPTTRTFNACGVQARSCPCRCNLFKADPTNEALFCSAPEDSAELRPLSRIAVQQEAPQPRVAACCQHSDKCC